MGTTAEKSSHPCPPDRTNFNKSDLANSSRLNLPREERPRTSLVPKPSNSRGEIIMRFFDRIPSLSLEHREMQLILTTSAAIIVLAGGLVLYMYPVVFPPAEPPNRTLASAFFGFCVISVLLAWYPSGDEVMPRSLDSVFLGVSQP
jgi:hypothetical protein